MQTKYLTSTGKAVGIPNLGGHTLRHTYRAVLRQLQVRTEVQQKLMRQADISTTMQAIRARSVTEGLRPHNAALAAMLQE